MTKRKLSLHQDHTLGAETGAEPHDPGPDLLDSASPESDDEVESEETERTDEHVREGDPADDAEPAETVERELELGTDNTLLQEPPRAFSPTIQLPTPHHWRLTKVAIDDRIASLKSIAKKVSDEGYIREARIMEQDALALSEDVSPQLEVQAEIPLATADEVRSGVANELRGVVRRRVRRDQEDVDHEALMLKELGERVEAYACEIANRAYAAGLQAREATAEVFALKSLNALRK